MSLVYHEKTRHRQIGITIRQTQKPLTLYEKDSSFMALKEVHIENVKKGGNAGYEHFLLFLLLCTYPVLPSSVHVCIYFWFPLWLFLELDFLLWNIVLEVSGLVYNLITRNYASNFNMNFLEVSLLL